MTHAPRRLATALVGLGLLVGLSGCSGGTDSPSSAATGADTSTGSTASTTAVVRWWSNAAARTGSTIDVNDPTDAARSLSPSRAQYCTMLEQTVAAGRSVLPNLTASDPGLRAATTAFVGELQAVAPPPVAGPWRTIGAVLRALVTSGGDLTKVKSGEPKATAAAVRTVAADARARCRVELGR